VSTTGAKCAKL